MKLSVLSYLDVDFFILYCTYIDYTVIIIIIIWSILVIPFAVFWLEQQMADGYDQEYEQDFGNGNFL